MSSSSFSILSSPLTYPEILSTASSKDFLASGLNLIIALDYGGREDIRRSIINIYNKYKQNNIPIEEISFEEIESNLMTRGIPNPDLIIRTSGEYRISNFLLWQSAYSEYEFVKCNWPDFDNKTYLKALKSFEKRDRRFGKLNE